MVALGFEIEITDIGIERVAGAGVVDIVKLVRVGAIERAEEEGLIGCEDGGIDADTGREGQDRKGGEAGMLGEHAGREAEVVGDTFDERQQVGFAHVFL